jgi:hypothetical protein
MRVTLSPTKGTLEENGASVFARTIGAWSKAADVQKDLSV